MARSWRKALRIVGVGFGSLTITAAFGTVVFLNVVGPPANYDFLESHPVLESAVSGFASETKDVLSEFRVFAWDQPYDAALPAIEAELTKRGFRRNRHARDLEHWSRGQMEILVSAERVVGRPALERSKKDRSCVMVVVGRPVEDDWVFHFRLAFSPYGITQA